MQFRDKEKTLLIDVLSKTAEYVLALMVLGSVIAERFHLWLFLVGLAIYFGLITAALFISSQTKE